MKLEYALSIAEDLGEDSGREFAYSFLERVFFKFLPEKELKKRAADLLKKIELESFTFLNHLGQPAMVGPNSYYRVSEKIGMSDYEESEWAEMIKDAWHSRAYDTMLLVIERRCKAILRDD